METKKEVSTKVRKDAEEAIKTNLTINWDDMSPEDIRDLAQAALIVKLQGQWRNNGIPTECTVKAADHKVGVRVKDTRTPLEKALAALSALPADQRAAALAKYQ